MTVITSTANPMVKFIRGLSRRKERERTGLFYVEGIRLVAEAADLNVEVETCVVAPQLLSSDFGWKTVDRLIGAGATRLEVSEDVFRTMSSKDGPQGIAAVVRQHWTELDEIEPGTGLCWIALDTVQDAGNLGTILRTSDAVGAGGVILLGDTADPYDPGAVRASMGALFSQRLTRAQAPELAAWKHHHGAQVVGTSDSAQIDYLAAEYRRPLVLFMGSEREGLGEAEMAVCDLMVRIPMVGRSDSLNLAVATGVMLYEILRQRRQTG